jgi:hypothetical protein
MAKGFEKFLDDGVSAIGDAQGFLNSKNNPLSDAQRDQFKSNGFGLPAVPSADGNGLPYSKVKSMRDGQIKRNIITWFVPEFGIVRMYINPNSLVFSHKKLIDKTRTKGGYTLQYWGEDLTTISLSGTTGSSGVEGINMLYEIYRAEQYGFDAVGLSLDAKNAAVDIANNLISGIGGAIGGSAGAGIGGLLGGLLGSESNNNNLSNTNIPTLAQLAFSVEMYYNGAVYRGYFESMTVTERADNFLHEYQINFVVTQKRGYRLNYMPFHKSPNEGPSQYNTNNSFNGHVKDERAFVTNFAASSRPKNPKSEF